MRKFIPYFRVLLITAAMLFFPGSSITYAKQAMDMCYNIIIPSLFPFFVCSGLLIYSGFAQSLSQFFRPVMKPLFNINGCGAAAFVLGIISGYPLGAVTACQLYNSGYLSKSETERLLAFCNNSGPLFILGAVGSAIYASSRIGIILYSAHILAAVSVGILFRFYARNKHSAPAYSIGQDRKSFSEVFSTVLSNSISSILTVCGAVIFFSVVSNIVAGYIPESSVIKPLFIGIMELTGGTKSISSADISLTEKLVLSAFVVGFAGICVHLQVMAVVSAHHLSLKPYIIGKIIHGILAAFYTLVLLKIFPQTETVFRNTQTAMNAGFCISSLYSVITVLFITLLASLLIIFGTKIYRRCHGNTPLQ